MDQDTRILIVDDEHLSRDLSTSVLARHGFTRTFAAASAASALEVLQCEKIQCVVTDHDMPNMTGLELLDCIRTNAKLSTLPVILVSGHLTEELRAEAMRRGVTACLAKPHTPLTLISALSDAVSGEKARLY